VACLAEGLPVVRIPEEGAIALVRADVVDDGRRHDQTLALAFGAERMLAQKSFASSAPSAVIAAGRGGAALAVIALPALACMSRAIGRRGQRSAAGMVARMRRRVGHAILAGCFPVYGY